MGGLAPVADPPQNEREPEDPFHDEDGDDDQEEGPQLSLVGGGSLGNKVGGRVPDSAVLKYKGAKVELQGQTQFDRGERIIAVDIWQVTGDNDQDTIDTASGDVKSTSKSQNATLCGSSRIEDYLASKITDRRVLEEVCEALDLATPPIQEAA